MKSPWTDQKSFRASASSVGSVRFVWKFPNGIFTPCDLFPPWSGFSEFVVSSPQFCHKKNKFSIILSDPDFFRIQSSRIYIWCVQLSKSWDHTSGYTFSGLAVAWFFVSLPPDHIYPSGDSTFNKVNFVNPVQESDKLWFASTFQLPFNTFFLQHIQICVGGPCQTVFRWNWECFFFPHMELNSRFIVMTTNEVTLNRPTVFLGFTVVSWFCRLRPFRFALKFSTEVFTPYGSFPP